MIILISAFVLTVFCLLAAATIVSFIIPLVAKKVDWIDLSDDDEKEDNV